MLSSTSTTDFRRRRRDRSPRALPVRAPPRASLDTSSNPQILRSSDPQLLRSSDPYRNLVGDADEREAREKRRGLAPTAAEVSSQEISMPRARDPPRFSWAPATLVSPAGAPVLQVSPVAPPRSGDFSALSARPRTARGAATRPPAGMSIHCWVARHNSYNYGLPYPWPSFPVRHSALIKSWRCSAKMALGEVGSSARQQPSKRFAELDPLVPRAKERRSQC